MDKTSEARDRVSVVEQGEFHLLLPTQVNWYWKQMEAWFIAEPEMWRGHTLEEIRHFLDTGDLRAWTLSDDEGIKACLITTVTVLATERVLWIKFAFGREIRKFLPLARPALMLVARKLDCKRVMFTGRRGWEKLLKGLFEFHSVTLQLEVKDEGEMLQ